MLEMFGIKIEPMEPIAIKKEPHVLIIRGKPYEGALYRLRGWARYTDPAAGVVVADAATFTDGGREGVSKVYSKDARAFTPEERKAGRERIREIITQIMVDQGIW